MTRTTTSVSQYGITWEFDGEYTVGQYATGDWWVEGPVRITKITPESTDVDGRVVHGTMVTPRGDAQGYDDYETPKKDAPSKTYDESLNRAPSRTGEPLELDTGTVFSSISLSDEEIGEYGRPTLQDLAVLTVVDERPADDAFRPNPYSVGEGTSQWTESDLDYSLLGDLPVVEPTPDLDLLVDQALRFWNEQSTTWKQRPVQARNNQPDYGRDLGKRNGQMLLLLHQDIDADVKRDLFVGLVQYGLDVYGRLRTGGKWEANGGHNNGRKMPMLLAGLALDDSDIVAAADRTEGVNRFQEDGQTFFVTEDDVGKDVHDGHETYSQEDVGMPEWGVKHASQEVMDDSRWNASYRWIGSAFVPHALAAHLTPGAVEAWNSPAFFQYTDRFEERGSPAPDDVPSNQIGEFAQACWDEYRTSTGTVTVTATGETIPNGGTATVSVDAESVEAVVCRDLWTDWAVTVEDPAGTTTTDDRVSTAGEFELQWDSVQGSVTPSLAVSPPGKTYVGGSYEVEVTATGDDGSASDTARIEIGDSGTFAFAAEDGISADGTRALTRKSGATQGGGDE